MDSEANSKRSNTREGSGAIRNWEVNASKEPEVRVRDKSWKTPSLWAPKLGATKEKREYGARDEHRSTERERCSVLAQGKPCDYGIVTLCPSPDLWLSMFYLSWGRASQRQGLLR